MLCTSRGSMDDSVAHGKPKSGASWPRHRWEMGLMAPALQSASWNSRVPIMEITRALGIQPTMTWSPGDKVRNTRLVHILSSWRWARDEWDAAPFGSETNGA